MFAKRSRITKSKRLCCDLSLVAVLSFLMVGSVFGQSPKPAIRLVKQDVSGARLQVLPEQERALVAKMPDNFYHFGSVTGAEAASPQWLTLEFSVATQITRISSTPDFKVLQGGTCEAGRYYQAESSCQLLVQFTPQGAGHRLGKVTVNHTASETPTSISLLAFAQFGFSFETLAAKASAVHKDGTKILAPGNFFTDPVSTSSAERGTWL